MSRKMVRSNIHQCGLPGFQIEDFIRESIEFIREHEPVEGYYVGFSGGKDSITTLELCRMAGVKHEAYYSCTRIDPPEIYSFIKTNYPDVKWLYPNKSFWQLIVEKMPPFRMVRWCCDDLKKKPASKIPLSRRIMGIRKEESVRRASRPRIDKYRKNQILYKPIFDWTEWVVWEFIEKRKLAYPFLYDEGWSRLGCVVCPFILGTSPAQIANRTRSMARYPGIWKAFEHAVKRWFQEKGSFGGFRYNQKIRTPDQF